MNEPDGGYALAGHHFYRRDEAGVWVCDTDPYAPRFTSWAALLESAAAYGATVIPLMPVSQHEFLMDELHQQWMEQG